MSKTKQNHPGPPKVIKHPTSFKLSDTALDILAELAIERAVAKSAVVESLLREEKTRTKTRKESTVMIDWSKISGQDYSTIVSIANRAKTTIPASPCDKLSLIMDISAAHLDVGLRLQELANADDFNFNHDVAGIVRHMNRETGKLDDFFLPRFAARRQG